MNTIIHSKVNLHIYGNITLNTNEIVFLKSSNNYTLIRTIEGEEVISSKNIGYYEDILSNTLNFIRTHKSYIVNLSFINELKFNCRGGVVVIEKEKIEISRRKAAEFRRNYRLFLNSKGQKLSEVLPKVISNWKT